MPKTIAYWERQREEALHFIRTSVPKPPLRPPKGAWFPKYKNPTRRRVALLRRRRIVLGRWYLAQQRYAKWRRRERRIGARLRYIEERIRVLRAKTAYDRILRDEPAV